MVIREQQATWNCEAAGLEVTPGDIILINILGGATDEGQRALRPHDVHLLGADPLSLRKQRHQKHRIFHHIEIHKF